MNHSQSGQSPIAEDGGFGPMHYESDDSGNNGGVEEDDDGFEEFEEGAEGEDFGDFDDGFQEPEEEEEEESISAPPINPPTIISPPPFVSSLYRRFQIYSNCTCIKKLATAIVLISREANSGLFRVTIS